jgi:hypothetical protein
MSMSMFLEPCQPTQGGFFCAQKFLKHALVNFCMKAFKALYIEPSLLKVLDFVYATYTPFTPFTPYTPIHV